MNITDHANTRIKERDVPPEVLEALMGDNHLKTMVWPMGRRGSRGARLVRSRLPNGKHHAHWMAVEGDGGDLLTIVSYEDSKDAKRKLANRLVSPDRVHEVMNEMPVVTIGGNDD